MRRSLLYLVAAVVATIAMAAWYVALHSAGLTQSWKTSYQERCWLVMLSSLNTSEYRHIVNLLNTFRSHILVNASIGYAEGYLDVRKFARSCVVALLRGIPENVTELWRLGVRRPLVEVRIYFGDVETLESLFNTSLCSSCAIVSDTLARCLNLTSGRMNVIRIAYLKPDSSCYALRVFVNKTIAYLRRLEEELGVKLVNVSWENLSLDVLREVRKRLDSFGNVILNVTVVKTVRTADLQRLLGAETEYIIVVPYELMQSVLARYEKQYWPVYTRITLVLVTDSEELAHRISQLVPNTELRQITCKPKPTQIQTELVSTLR
jgi:hypothetical protein